MKIRINKHLASLGIASRRKIDDMIEKKQIKVNNQLATPGQKIDPQKDQVEVDGQKIQNKSETLEYIIVNKPKGYFSTTKSFPGKKSVLELVKTNNRLYPVGRLDKDSQGLILLTNDGDLAYKLTHPKHHVSKTYHVTILGKVQSRQLSQLQKGIKLEDGVTQPADVKIIRENYPKETMVEIVLYEGKKRQIRRMCAHLHLFIKKLERVAIGPINIGSLGIGKSRQLTSKEVKTLKK